jgi:hypothetical protein
MIKKEEKININKEGVLILPEGLNDEKLSFNLYFKTMTKELNINNKITLDLQYSKNGKDYNFQREFNLEFYQPFLYNYSIKNINNNYFLQILINSTLKKKIKLIDYSFDKNLVKLDFNNALIGTFINENESVSFHFQLFDHLKKFDFFYLHFNLEIENQSLNYIIDANISNFNLQVFLLN